MPEPGQCLWDSADTTRDRSFPSLSAGTPFWGSDCRTGNAIDEPSSLLLATGSLWRSPSCRLTGTTRRGSGYNAKLFDQASDATMEAEQLNSIENRIADVGERAGELRRYL